MRVANRTDHPLTYFATNKARAIGLCRHGTDEKCSGHDQSEQPEKVAPQNFPLVWANLQNFPPVWAIVIRKTTRSNGLVGECLHLTKWCAKLCNAVNFRLIFAGQTSVTAT